jgi:large conductance mechanosensitive channel
MSERTTSSIHVRPPAWLDEFRAFIMRGNVVDLAVGIIIGVAFTAVVNSLVKDIFTPIIGMLVGGIDFTNIFVTLKGQSAATLADAQKAGAVTLNIGVFLNAVIQFLIVSFAVFWMIKVLTRLHVRQDAAPAAERSIARGNPRSAGSEAKLVTEHFSLHRRNNQRRLRCARGRPSAAVEAWCPLPSPNRPRICCCRDIRPLLAIPPS